MNKVAPACDGVAATTHSMLGQPRESKFVTFPAVEFGEIVVKYALIGFIVKLTTMREVIR